MPIKKPTKKQQKVLKKLGERFKAIRVEKGLTQKDVAYKLEKDKQSISRFESGAVNPTLIYLLEVCDAMNLQLSDLIREITTSES